MKILLSFFSIIIIHVTLFARLALAFSTHHIDSFSLFLGSSQKGVIILIYAKMQELYLILTLISLRPTVSFVLLFVISAAHKQKSLSLSLFLCLGVFFSLFDLRTFIPPDINYEWVFVLLSLAPVET